MSFFLVRTQPNGAISTHHRIARVELVAPHARVTLDSFATEAAFAAGQLNWQDTHTVPWAQALDAETWLVSPAGPFAGATVLVESTLLETARSLRWAEIKAERDRRETAGFAYLGRTIDSDPRSVQRITIAAQAAQAAIAAGVPFDVAWTCADDSTLALDARAMADMPAALAAHADALHRIARALRERLLDSSVDSIEAVAAIGWSVVGDPVDHPPSGADTTSG
jgi:hypothetical protein